MELFVVIASLDLGPVDWLAMGFDAGDLGPTAAAGGARGLDFKLVEIPGRGLDLDVQQGDLVMDRGLVTAAIASLWTDRRAEPDDGIPFDEDPRGYWADREGARWGSRLWQLKRAKATSQAIAQAEEFCTEAFAWWRSSGIASKVTCTASIMAGGRLVVQIGMERDPRPRWSAGWDGTSVEIGLDGGAQALRVLTG